MSNTYFKRIGEGYPKIIAVRGCSGWKKEYRTGWRKIKATAALKREAGLNKEVKCMRVLKSGNIGYL